MGDPEFAFKCRIVLSGTLGLHVGRRRLELRSNCKLVHRFNTTGNIVAHRSTSRRHAQPEVRRCRGNACGGGWVTHAQGARRTRPNQRFLHQRNFVQMGEEGMDVDLDLEVPLSNFSSFSIVSYKKVERKAKTGPSFEDLKKEIVGRFERATNTRFSRWNGIDFGTAAANIANEIESNG